jgi:hypothetical protein
MTEFNLKSAESGKNYTMGNVLQKMRDRAFLMADTFKFVDFTDMCRYNSRDALLVIENLRVSKSRWCDSLNFSLDLEIPVHFTHNGKMEFFAGMDDADIENPYKKVDAKGSVKVWIFENEVEEISIDNKFITTNSNFLLEIIQLAFFQISFAFHEDAEKFEDVTLTDNK